MATFFFDSGSVTGAAIIAVASILAILCLLLVLLHMTFAVAAPSYSSRMSSPQERYFITSPLGYYIVSLFLSNLLSSLGGLLELQWVGPRGITEGPSCTVQAFLVQLGSNAEALWLGVISLSALQIFMFRGRPWRKAVALILIAMLWVVMIIFNAVVSTAFHNNALGFFYGASNLWCWITPRYTTARTLTYTWVWVWSFISVVCFLLVFLSVRGNLVVRRSLAGTAIRLRKRSFNSYALGNSSAEYFGNLVGTVGKTMAWFPIVYIMLSLPLSLARVIETTGFLVPAYAMTITSAVYALLGVGNTFLYFAIRHSLKHSALHISSDTTLRGSYGAKSPTDSFSTPPEKRSSPTNKFPNDVWVAGPTTKEWRPPPQHLVEDHQARLASPTSTRSPLSPRPLPPVPVEALTGNGSAGGINPVGGRLRAVQETDLSSGSRPGAPPITIPSAAVLPRDKVNAVSPVDMSRLADVPFTPTDRKGSIGSLSNMLAGLEKPVASASTGPVAPPPRKARRQPVTSMPVDVDEFDEGSIYSNRSVEAFPPELAQSVELNRHLSVGDVANRNPSTRRTRIDSMKSFWAAYEDASPKTPTMPMPMPPDAQTIKSRDTMRTFWAAYEDSSPRVPAFPDDLLRRPESAYPESAFSPDFKSPPIPTIKTSHFSTVGGQAITKDDSEIQPPVPAMKSSSDNEHRRSRSYTAGMPKPLAPAFSLTPSVSRQSSATAVDPTAKPVPTGLQIASALRNKGHSPTPSASGYRPPRPQPGYL